jgi:hypothetical protein
LNKADLGKTVKNLNKTLVKVDGIMKGLEAGNGTMGKLLNDDTIYYLSKTSKELELLLQDVRLHPTRYVNVSLLERKKNHIKLLWQILFQRKKLVIMSYLDNILFALLLVIGFGYFSRSLKKIKRNINLGIVDRKDNPGARWKNMAMIAGTVKNGKRRSWSCHCLCGFLIINIELLEIIIDGLFGTHRVFAFWALSMMF